MGVRPNFKRRYGLPQDIICSRNRPAEPTWKESDQSVQSTSAPIQRTDKIKSVDDTGKPTIRKGLNGPGKFEEHIKSRSSEDYSIIYKANKAAIEETAKESYLRSKHRRKDDAHTHQSKTMLVNGNPRYINPKREIRIFPKRREPLLPYLPPSSCGNFMGEEKVFLSSGEDLWQPISSASQKHVDKVNKNSPVWKASFCKISQPVTPALSDNSLQVAQQDHNHNEEIKVTDSKAVHKIAKKTRNKLMRVPVALPVGKEIKKSNVSITKSDKNVLGEKDYTHTQQSITDNKNKALQPIVSKDEVTKLNDSDPKNKTAKPVAKDISLKQNKDVKAKIRSDPSDNLYDDITVLHDKSESKDNHMTDGIEQNTGSENILPTIVHTLNQRSAPIQYNPALQYGNPIRVPTSALNENLNEDLNEITLQAATDSTIIGPSNPLQIEHEKPFNESVQDILKNPRFSIGAHIEVQKIHATCPLSSVNITNKEIIITDRPITAQSVCGESVIARKERSAKRRTVRGL